MTRKSFKRLIALGVALGAASLLWIRVIGPAILSKMIKDANEGGSSITVRDNTEMDKIKADPDFVDQIKAESKKAN